MEPANQFRIPQVVPARMEELGFSAAQVLRRAGLPQNLFQHDRIVLNAAQWFALWRVIDEINPDPGLGLHMSSVLEGGPYDPLLITALSAPTFHGALTRVARFKRLFSPEDIRVCEQNNAWSVEVASLFADYTLPSLLVDATLSCLNEIGRHGTGMAVLPERVFLRRDETECAMYETYFRCPVDFEAERDMLLYSHATIMQHFLTHNQELLAMIEPQLEAALHQSPPERLVDHVKTLMRSRLAGEQPTTQDIARELNISTRTLQRRLTEEGVSFQHLLETVRCDMAKHYLAQSPLELNEIAFLLGYKAPSSFHRAFHTWEGCSPGQWRAAQQHEHIAVWSA